MNTEDEICVVCCREIPLYATGPCDHPVCYECSTRMRVLCEQNECPICRGNMPSVVFTHRKQLFSSVPKFPLRNTKYTIAFEDRSVENAFHILLEHRCGDCGDVVVNFEDLKKHVSRSHNMFYCELCVDNLKIFPSERKCYTRPDLAHHKRKGDPDNTSHRGHPLCQFCDKRFVDFDELYRHLRKEHYFCHFCDADGNLDGEFYDNYSHLKVHFRTRHFLCEEGDCASEQFVRAFRSDIDFKAHIASMHAKNKSKAELVQTRTLDLEFSITPRNAVNSDWSPNHSDQRRGRFGNQNNYERKRNMNEIREDANAAKEEEKQQSFDTQCVQDFPLLANGVGEGVGGRPSVEENRYSSRASVKGSTTRKQTWSRPVKHALAEDFPALSTLTEPSTSHRSTDLAAKRSVIIQAQSGSTMSNHQGVDWQGWRKPPASVEVKEKVIKKPSPTWRSSMKGLMDLEEEFPKLKTKEPPVPRVPETSEWVRLTIQPKETEESVSMQLYQKCKSKKKKKNATPIHEPKPNHQPIKPEPPKLTKLYTGLGNQSVLGNEENEDPYKDSNIKLHDKLEKFKALATQDEDDTPWSQKADFIADDFPPLAPPVVATRCPPGFSSSSMLKATASIPPPGFSDKFKSEPQIKSCISLSSIAQQLCNTNNNNSVKALNQENDALYSYQHPPNFQLRNTKLVQRIYELLDSDVSFEEFKKLSGGFRKDSISATDYHANCMRILGKERFMQLFEELLCLLPDITKQQELFSAHNKFLQSLSSYGAVPKQKHASLATCQSCRQVLLKTDYDCHMGSHRNRVKE